MSGIFDTLDPEQLRAVAIRENAAVSAGAGSGKTTVLAARYLRLVLEEAADVRSVLCLTFTRKAAAEMRERIYRELQASGERRAREQIERFADAAISTIDSFCSQILRSSAQDYGYAPDFAVDDTAARDLAESEALAFLLERRDEQSLAEVLARLGFERAWKELFADVAHRHCSPAGGFPSDFAAMAQRAKVELDRLAGLRLESCRSAMHRVLAAADLATGTLGSKAEAACTLCRGALEGLETVPLAEADLAAVSELVAPLADFTLVGFGRSEEDAEIKAAMKEARELALMLGRLAEARGVEPLNEALLRLLGEFGERFRAAKRRSGLMSFRDAAVCAVDLLTRRPEIRRHWKGRFRYVMIDEFQDDDELQRDLLYLLGEREGAESAGVPKAADLAPGKLFFVGDDKQSIYRFRGADVSVFRGLAGELSGSGAAEAPPALGMNYRSEPELVTFFNELFSRVFAGASEEYEARFSPIGHREPTPGLKPEILYLYKRRAAGGGELLSEDEALADGVARYIRSAVGRLPLKSAEVGAPRRAEPDDFAILLRSTAKQYLIERFLRLHQLPYTVDSPRGLFLESVANDIYAALHLCLYEDRASYAAVLRSPLVRLSDDGFVCVLASGQRVFGQAEEELLDSSDRERFRRGREMLGRLRAMADRRPCAELVRSLWYEEGLRLAILRKPGAEPYLDHYDYLLALAVRADAEGRSLAAFISSLEPLMGRPERLDELEVPRESARGVRIMTIHKAKGLEFPVVILPGMEGGGQADGVGAAWYLSPSVGVTVNLKSFDDPKAKSSNVFYESEREKEERRRAAESRRLFYVACTRASAHLVFAGVEPNAARGPSFHSFLCAESAAGDPAAEEGREGTGLEPMPGLPAAVRLVELPDLTTSAYLGLFGGSVPRPLEPRLPEYRNAANIERHWERRTLGVAEINAAYWEELGATGESESLPACDYDGHAATVSPARFGELCHAVLECELLGRDRTPALAGALDALPAELRGLLHADAQRMGRGFLQSPLGGLLRRARDLRTEWAFLLDLGEGSTAAGRIDLAFRHEDCLYVVDFKSDRERRPGEYDLQLELYRRAAAALLPAGSVKSYLFWLRSGEAEERAGEHSSGELRRWIGLAARSRPSGAGA